MSAARAVTAFIHGVATLCLAPLPGAAGAADDSQWTLLGKDLAATRYNALDEIKAGNVRSLRPVWSFSTGVLGGHEGQPLVVNDTLYVVTPWPNVLHAFDPKTADGTLRFKHRPGANRAALGVACCDAVNRGAAFAQGRIVYNLLDGRTVAIDATTRKELRKITVADLARGETITMAPLVVGERLLVGPSGCEFGIHGFVGLDLATGAIAWRARNIRPDEGRS